MVNMCAFVFQVEEVPIPASSKGKETDLQPVKGGTLTDISDAGGKDFT